MDATNILKLMDEVHGSGGLYLLAPINQVAGFFTSQNNLIYIAQDDTAHSTESVETDYLQLQTHVWITGVKNNQTFHNGFYNLIIYKEIINIENTIAFINLCETHACHREELNFKDFFYSLITLFQLPKEQSYKNAVGLFGELKLMQFAREKSNIDLSFAWHRNGTYSRYDFSSSGLCLEVKTTSVEEDIVTIKHKQIFVDFPCYLAVITCGQYDSGQTINELILDMQKEKGYFDSINFSINLAKELRRISPNDAQNLRFEVVKIRLFSAPEINPFEEIPDNVTSLTYKLELSDFESLSTHDVCAVFSQLK